MIMESWLETAPGSSESGLFIHGTRTADDVCVEVRRRLRGKALTIPLLVRTVHDITIDWSKQGWLTEPLAVVLSQLIGQARQEPVAAGILQAADSVRDDQTLFHPNSMDSLRAAESPLPS